MTIAGAGVFLQRKGRTIPRNPFVLPFKADRFHEFMYFLYAVTKIFSEKHCPRF
jgi:hypothetical protein